MTTGKRLVLFLVSGVFLFTMLYFVLDLSVFTTSDPVIVESSGSLNGKSFPFKKLPKTDRIDLAWQQEFERTKDPALGYVPRERLQFARQYSLQKREQLKSLRKSYGNMGNMGIAGIDWTERGPNNIGGRTRALMYDPNDGTGKKVWAAGVTGGLWYNNDITDNDSPWQKVDDFWDNIAVTCIAYDPNNTNIFYVGTGEGFTAGGNSSSRGDGVWKSTDGGSSWSQLSASTGFYWVNDIAVRNESGTSALYAGTAREYHLGGYFGSPDQGLYRSTDGGSSFTQVLPLPSGSTRPYSVADIEIAADNRIYIGTEKNSTGYGGGTILYSDNGSSGTWTVNTNYSSISGVARVELACAPSNANIVYALIEANLVLERVGYSSDKGATWTDMSEPNDADVSIPGTDFSRGQAWYDLILAVDPNDATKVYAGAIDLFRGIYSGGNISWTQISKWSNNSNMNTLNISVVHADQHAIIFKTGSSTETFLSNDGGIYYSDNFNSSPPDILERNKDYNTIQYYACAIHPTAATNHFLGGCQDNGSHRLTSIGVGPAIEVSGGDGAFCHIDQDESSYQFTAYTYNNLYRSTDGGQTFTAVISDGNGSFINPSDYDNVNDKMYSAYSNGQYLRWNDPQTGTSTTAVSVTDFNSGKVTTVSVSPNTSNRVFFGLNNGRVVRADNAHSTPTTSYINSGAGMPTTSSVSCIAIENGDDNHLLVTYYNYGVTSVWETTDGGSNWTNVEGNLPDMPVRWALFDPTNSDRALLATEVGVWSSDNLNGTSTQWDPSVSGLANVRVDMFRTRTSDNLIIAATHGRGLFTTDAFSSAQAQFDADRTTWLINRPIQFQDGSLQATSWSWNFGDGNTSTEQNPAHVYTSTGTYTVSLSINGGASTESKTNYITILSDPAIPYSQDFNSNNGAFYAHSISEEENYWQWGAGTSGKPNYNPEKGMATLEGAASWITNLTGSHGTNTIYALDSPPFNLEGGTGSYTLDFKYRMLLKGNTGGDVNAAGFNVQYSTDGGDNWTILGSPGASWYTDNSIAGLNGDPGFWRGAGTWTTIFNPSIDITSLIGNSDVRFRFVFGASYSQWDGAQIDNFQITGNSISPVAGPTSVDASNITTSSADVSWSGTSSEFRVVRTEGGPASSPTSGTLVYEGSSTNSTASSLTELSTYYFTAYGKASGSQAYSSAKEHIAAVISTANSVSTTVPANQTGTYVFGTTGSNVNIGTNQDSDGGTMQVDRFNSSPTGNNTISGSATAPDASTVTPNKISTERYWTITTNLTGSNSYTVSLDITGLSGVSNPDKLLILKRDGGGWVAQNTTRDGNTLSSTVSSLSDFGIGADDNDNPLPVTLSAFAANIQNNRVILKWVTESEINNEKFILQKSLDGQSFYPLANIPGHGNSSVRQEYKYVDEQVQVGNIYHYSLSSVDYNGTMNLYDTLIVDFSAEILPVEFALYSNFPNPFNPSTNIKFDLPAGKTLYPVNISVYNVLGQKVRTLLSTKLEPGRYTEVWDGRNDLSNLLSSGTYFLVIKAGNNVATDKMLLLR